jgi:hypothetical protein
MRQFIATSGNLIAAIVELVAGLILLAAVFVYVRSRLLFAATLWLVNRKHA